MPMNNNLDTGGNRNGHPQSMAAGAAAQRNGLVVSKYDR